MFSEPHKIEHDRVSSNQDAVSESKRIVGKKKIKSHTKRFRLDSNVKNNGTIANDVILFSFTVAYNEITQSFTFTSQ